MYANTSPEMRKILTLIFVFSLLWHNALTQSKKLSESSDYEALDIQFNPSYPTVSLPNYFIDKIAAALPKIRMYTKVHYHYQLRTEVLQTTASKYRIRIWIDTISHGGNYTYKDFDFSHLIAPVQIDQTLKILDITSNRNYLRKFRINFRTGDTLEFPLKDLKGVFTSKVKIQPQGVKAVYTASQKDKFDAAIRDIDRYYHDVAQLDELKKKLQSLDFSRADVVALRNVDLKYIEKDMAKIRPQEYSATLNLSAYDPARLLIKYDSLQNMIAGRRRMMNSKMNALEQVYYDQALKELAEGNEAEAVELFENAVRVNPYFAPAEYQLAQLDFRHGHYRRCLTKVQVVLNEMKPVASQKTESIRLGQAAFDSLMRICEALNREERFNESTQILYDTKAFCDSTADFDCDQRLDENISTAVYGLYASYLSLARASLRKGRTDFCGDYLAMATNYKNTKPEILNKEYPAANALVVDLIDSLVQQSAKAGTQGRHAQAKKLLDEAKKLCSEHRSSGCMAVINKEEGKMYRAQYNELVAQSVRYSKLGQGEKSKEYLSLAMTFQQLHPEYIPTSIGTDTIEGKVRVIMYREYIANARRELQQKRFSEALQELSEARKLETEYVFPKDDSLVALMQKAAKPMILDSLKLGQLKAWGKFYARARQLLDTARQMTALYGLSGDPEIARETAKLQLKIKKGRCEKISERYTALLKKGNMSEQMNDFYYAALFWQQAIDTARQTAACSIDVSIARLKLKKYRHDIEYAVHLHRADSIGERNPEAAFNHLLRAEQIRARHQNEMKSAKTLLELLLAKKSPALNIQGIRYFVKQKEAEAAYKLCVYTLESGTEVPDELQEATARLLAEYDREKQSASPAQMAEHRFGSKKELQGMKKVYLRVGR